MSNYSFASLRVHLRILLREGRPERALEIAQKTLVMDEKQARAYLDILTDYLTNRQVLPYKVQPWRVVLLELAEEMEAGEMPNEVYQTYTGASSMECYEIATLMFAAFHKVEWEGLDPKLHNYLETRDKLAKPKMEQVAVRRIAPIRQKA